MNGSQAEGPAERAHGRADDRILSEQRLPEAHEGSLAGARRPEEQRHLLLRRVGRQGIAHEFLERVDRVLLAEHLIEKLQEFCRFGRIRIVGDARRRDAEQFRRGGVQRPVCWACPAAWG